MSLIKPAALLTRAAEAEVLNVGATTMWLLADADATGGAVNANRAVFGPGTDGPPPHYHTGSAEIFFVLGGSLRVLAGDRVVTLDEGDFLMVPRNVPHAFAAPPEVGADILVVFAPGLEERFEYFRLGERVLKGEAGPEEILNSQQRFDNHFIEHPLWQGGRTEVTTQ
jgi:mannose-6-phosphate isomerase-like protein (cupin superfamily)